MHLRLMAQASGPMKVLVHLPPLPGPSSAEHLSKEPAKSLCYPKAFEKFLGITREKTIPSPIIVCLPKLMKTLSYECQSLTPKYK
eukprot:3688664-Pyramimonas_sp.AAC.1